jgi:hypothetical protein
MVPRTTSPSKLTNMPTPGSFSVVPVVRRNSLGVRDSMCGFNSIEWLRVSPFGVEGTGAGELIGWPDILCGRTASEVFATSSEVWVGEVLLSRGFGDASVSRVELSGLGLGCLFPIPETRLLRLELLL